MRDAQDELLGHGIAMNVDHAGGGWRHSLADSLGGGARGGGQGGCSSGGGNGGAGLLAGEADLQYASLLPGGGDPQVRWRLAIECIFKRTTCCDVQGHRGCSHAHAWGPC
eukprot:252817-Chlamydomonas_euryale.AAC.6